MLFILVIVCARWLITEEEPSPEKAPLISIPRGPVLVLGLLAFVAMIAEGAATDWSSIFARNELEATPSQAAAVFTVFALTMKNKVNPLLPGILTGFRIWPSLPEK